jgi:hypothetical protein
VSDVKAILIFVCVKKPGSVNDKFSKSKFLLWATLSAFIKENGGWRTSPL